MELGRPLDSRPESLVILESLKLNVVESICYIGDELCPGFCKKKKSRREVIRLKLNIKLFTKCLED